ncbi:sporulation peptidase YabG [Candidatus Epulonipiscium fishelsonii]|uniref:Sporulation peptidase YabG n=1 Tax=Candidatus Epulonipiscium fishelsonii TaxID=77094 RepID=A0ACC8XIA5_9FIRM|nr:sporulation peptidase YabG [Epulopiscium sp. SCG-D08WGA-EpuloA1]
MVIGDFVVRLSYNKDLLFRIIDIDNKDNVAKLKGISYRIIADAPIKDLELAGGMRFTSNESSTMEMIDSNVRTILKEHKNVDANKLQKVVKVLHVDGDPFYLNVCLRYYELLGVSAVGENVLESQQPMKIKELISLHNPDILVLTGHDSLNKIHKSTEDILEYRNSKYFIEAVKEARLVKPTTEQLVIYAGACQSHFEGILSAGADYASSPSRVLIHALDPPFIVERIAHCPFYKVLPIEEALKYTITKHKGLGGYDTFGKSRKGGNLERSALLKASVENS